MEYKSYESGVEVTGAGLSIMLESFKDFTLLASQIMLAEGIGAEDEGGIVRVDPEGWYPLDNYLRALQRVTQEVGDQIVYQGGLATPKHAKFPPDIKDVHAALGSIDIAYHMNHRKSGALMFDPTTGSMAEGIGHYRYQKADARKIIMTCANPYPCELDRGLITAMAKRFEPNANVTHDRTKPCRKQGGESCTLLINW